MTERPPLGNAPTFMAEERWPELQFSKTRQRRAQRMPENALIVHQRSIMGA